MGRHHLLLSLTIGHRFFTDGLCEGLTCVPTPASARLLRQTGLLTKYTGHGFQIFYDESRTEALQLYASDPQDPLCFGFKIFSNDRYFLNYTEPALSRDESILYFDNRVVKKTKIGSRLHAGDYVAADDFVPLNSPEIEGLLTKNDRLAKPYFLVKLFLGGAKRRLVDKNQRITAKEYYVTFRARETFWTYYVSGNLTKGQPVIADLDQKTQFEFAGNTPLPNQQTAHTFRSLTSLPLQESYSHRFQLREQNSGNGKILIKRLPVASPEQLTRAVIADEERMVSDIYVNC